MAFSRFRVLMLSIVLLAVASAATAQTTPTSIQLSWTAPGDDGTQGTATQYDLRYSTATITAANFASATRFNGTPTPTASGTSQTVTVTGLNPSTTYFFAIKSADDVSNWSAVSNVVTKATPAAPDLSPPGALAISVTSVGDTSATLGWTSSGDDSTVGTATSYDIRRSANPITDANWGSATTVTGEPVPAVSGTNQSYVVKGLTRETTYYFAMKASDEAGNVSAMSNVPSTTTNDTLAPSTISNLSANFFWMAWHSASAVRPRGTEAH